MIDLIDFLLFESVSFTPIIHHMPIVHLLQIFICLDANNRVSCSSTISGRPSSSFSLKSFGFPHLPGSRTWATPWRWRKAWGKKSQWSKKKQPWPSKKAPSSWKFGVSLLKIKQSHVDHVGLWISRSTEPCEHTKSCNFACLCLSSWNKQRRHGFQPKRFQPLQWLARVWESRIQP